MGYIYLNKFKDVTAFTTTRTNGHSLPPFDSFNQAYHVSDDKEHVLLNRLMVCNELNISQELLIVPAQMHTNDICKVDIGYASSGAFDFESGVKDCDALYTYDSRIALGVFHADCVPLFFHAPNKHLVGIIHAGMEGSLKSITEVALNKVMRDEGILPNEIHVHIGPAISFYHYEIDAKLKQRVINLGEGFIKALKYINGKTMLDIPLLNVMQLRKIGIPAENITMAGLCTFEDEKQFFSYRRNKTTGRHLSVIKLNK